MGKKLAEIIAALLERSGVKPTLSVAIATATVYLLIVFANEFGYLPLPITPPDIPIDFAGLDSAHTAQIGAIAAEIEDQYRDQMVEAVKGSAIGLTILGSVLSFFVQWALGRLVKKDGGRRRA